MFLSDSLSRRERVRAVTHERATLTSLLSQRERKNKPSRNNT